MNGSSCYVQLGVNVQLGETLRNGILIYLIAFLHTEPFERISHVVLCDIV